MKDYDGAIGIYSKNNALPQKLKEKFEQKYLEVTIFDNFNNVNINHFDYLIINLLDFSDELSIIKSVVEKIECKTLLIHSLIVKETEKFVKDSELQNLLNLNKNLGILLVPELLGKNVSYNSIFTSHDLIMQSILSERIKVKADSQLINTITIGKLVERIVYETFSFGISGRIISLIGPRRSKKTFVTKYLKVDESNIVYTKNNTETVDLYSTSAVRVDFSLRLAVKNTKDHFFSTTNIKANEVLIPKEVVKRKVFRAKKLFLIAIFFVLTPIYLIILSVILMYIATKTTFSNNKLSRQLIENSVYVSDLGRNLSFGSNFVYDSANIIHEIASLGSEGIILVDSGKQFMEKIMGDSLYDLKLEANNISASLDKIHTKISFLQSDVNELQGVFGKLLRQKLLNRRIDITEYKSKIFEAKNLFSRSSVLLGSEKPHKYLILFQNNMELRPTGGFIGSFGLVTFDKGRMSEIVVNDVYMADGQLRGHVDPPEPIRKYLGEGGWYLRDSNWDPDFVQSAEKAEWFLEKEIGEKVDGVIAIDLNFVKELLTITGPISLTDFNLVVDANNLYTLIQSEVENEFFPGSIKKATILTSLSTSLIEEVKNLDGDKYLLFFSKLYESLEKRYVQVYLHDNNAQEAIKNLGYSGEIDLSADCGLRCIQDGYSLIDANLGVNKSNLFIKRSQELSVSVSKTSIMHELTVNYENSANAGIGNMGVYKNYVRILLPQNASVSTELPHDLVDINGRKEAGFLIEVLPNTSKKLHLVWNIENKNLELGGQYNLKIRKQAGTEADKLVVNVYTPDLVLTGRSITSYNTNLGRDFKTKIFYK